MVITICGIPMCLDYTLLVSLLLVYCYYLWQARVSSTSFDEGDTKISAEEIDKGTQSSGQPEVDLISVLADQVVKENKKRQMGKRTPRKHRDEKKTSKKKW